LYPRLFDADVTAVWRLERRVVLKDAPLEAAQPHRRFYAEVAHKSRPCIVKGGKRLGLSARSVQRQHQAFAQPLVVWAARYQPFDLAYEGSVGAAELELRLDAIYFR